MADTRLDHNQASFLRTVQACGTSLVETVNHVLDFTKLSGNSKAGGVENVILPSKCVVFDLYNDTGADRLLIRVDLMQLVEEAVEGCWIGHRARLPAMGNPEIGSVYSPPKQDSQAPASPTFEQPHVETVIDIGFRPSVSFDMKSPIEITHSHDLQGWHVSCEKGGMRRVLMNIIGNSLKFTTVSVIYLQVVPDATSAFSERLCAHHLAGAASHIGDAIFESCRRAIGS